MKAEMIPKRAVGIHTDKAGGREPASAKVRNIIKKRIKTKDNANPMAI
jgi:hypothetical protein